MLFRVLDLSVSANFLGVVLVDVILVFFGKQEELLMCRSCPKCGLHLPDT